MGKTQYSNRRKKVGVLLRHERKCQHLEQVDLARIMGKRQDIISKIEAGNRRIDIVELIEYCEVLKFSLSEFACKIETFLYGEGLLPPPKSNKKNKKILVDVCWTGNKFSVSCGDIIPETGLFTANKLCDLQNEVKESFCFHMNEKIKNGEDVPSWFAKEEYEFEYNFHDATSLLKAYTPFLSLAAISRASGINESLLSQYANGLKKARPQQIKRILDALHKIGKELMATTL